MTTQTQPKPQTPPRATRPGGQIAAIVIGAIIALSGVAVAITGGGILAVFGGDGTIDSGRHSLSTSSTALVSEVADLDGSDDLADIVGRPTVRLSVHATGPTEGLFVGIGPAADVERYLAAAPIDEVTDFDVDPFEMTRNPRPGSKRPATPASQDFWVAEGSGTDAATLRWKVREGDYRLVLMNADGSRKVRADGDVGVTIPHLKTIAWSLIGGGLLLMAGGGGAIAVATRRRG